MRKNNGTPSRGQKSKFLAMGCLVVGMTCAASMGGTIFMVDHNDLPAVGTSAAPWGDFNLKNGSPTVVDLGGEKWYSNSKATDDGMRSDTGKHDPVADIITINGATIVTAVKPERYPDGNWCLIVDIFYDQLCLGINNQSGKVTVKVSGASGANHTWEGGVIPEEPGVLTLTVENGANPAFEVFWRGENDEAAVSMGTGNGKTGGQPYTALYPQANGRGYAGYINLGRNDPDGWSTYNGLIGDTYVLDEQLSGAALLALQDQVRSNMGIVGALPLAITEIQYDPDADPNPTVTLTWRSWSDRTYKAFVSSDLNDWGFALADMLGAAHDVIDDDGDHITVTFPLIDGLENVPDLFFRIEEEE